MNLQLSLIPDYKPTLISLPSRNELFLSEQLITYIGNKRSLLPFIADILRNISKDLGKATLSSLDLFSGSGSVARLLKLHSSYVIANDLEHYSFLINHCYLSNKASIDWIVLEQYHQETLAYIEEHLNGKAPYTNSWIRSSYAPCDEAAISKEDRCFYTVRNALFLDMARDYIHTLPSPYKELLLAPLLHEASVHVNTAGIFKGFYKNKAGIGQFGGEGKHALQRILGEITLELPLLSEKQTEYDIFQENANTLVDTLDQVDVAYLDPPYNQHPYGSNYFMLNAIAKNECPQEISLVSGIPVGWNRSNYNKQALAQDALFECVEKLKARYVIISYNSEGFISKEAFLAFLSQLGTVKVIEVDYNTFRGSRNLRNRGARVTEFLFVLKKGA
ncbi:MAG: DNA adenine methylase [Vampirovibrionales bacterium]|jgi:adenine-specific DNA-methyltransferase|nr:DNA adenine methylase [Vampirovibrionales bacterium]